MSSHHRHHHHGGKKRAKNEASCRDEGKETRKQDGAHSSEKDKKKKDHEEKRKHHHRQSGEKRERSGKHGNEKPSASSSSSLEDELRDKLMKRAEKREKRRKSESEQEPELSGGRERRSPPRQRSRSPFRRRRRSHSPPPPRRHDYRRHSWRHPNDREERIVCRGGFDAGRKHQSAEPVPLYLNRKVQRHAEEIQKRKLLWQKSAEQKKPSTNWNTLLAATGADEKSAEKFRKMMGIKETAAPQESGETSDEIKKHDELIRGLDVQYQTARLTTHMQRGVGLGFSSRTLELAPQKPSLPPPPPFTNTSQTPDTASPSGL